MPFEKIPLNDGNEIPAIAFGSGSKWKGKDVVDAVGQAIEAGFSHLDTAQYYKNEDDVGVAIRESGLARSELFVTTKYGGGDIQEAIQTSLTKLGLKQVDLYLIHMPNTVAGRFAEAWREFEKIKADGLAKSIGVSNFTLEQLQEIIKTAHVKPAVNQIKFHPYNYAENKALLEYAATHGIVIEAYSPLTPITQVPGGPVDIPVGLIAKRHGIAPTQVVLAWAKAKGVVIVTTSSSKQHLQEYLDVGDVELTKDDIAAIDEAGAKGPYSPLIRITFFQRARLDITLGAVLRGFCLGLLWFFVYHYWNTAAER
ncbi:Aldo/keto reductase [Pluteus cervinus]|uniref:Aldo/keto reductase n=1 Tax=Pluteus cervinus TaxID=181527 RepID=A0ACD3B040_9AGAR|nr:Aldo/keto reductase [Pluteus cervinus]